MVRLCRKYDFMNVNKAFPITNKANLQSGYRRIAMDYEHWWSRECDSKEIVTSLRILIHKVAIKCVSALSTCVRPPGGLRPLARSPGGVRPPTRRHASARSFARRRAYAHPAACVRPPGCVLCRNSVKIIQQLQSNGTTPFVITWLLSFGLFSRLSINRSCFDL